MRGRPCRPAEVSVLDLLDDGPYLVSDGHETVDAPQALAPAGCVRGGTWIPATPPPTYATAGRTWANVPEGIDF